MQGEKRTAAAGWLVTSPTLVPEQRARQSQPWGRPAPAGPGGGDRGSVEAKERHKLFWPPHRGRRARLSATEGVRESPRELGQRRCDRP